MLPIETVLDHDFDSIVGVSSQQQTPSPLGTRVGFYRYFEMFMTCTI